MSPTSRLALAATCVGVAAMAAVAAILGIFARGSGEFETVTSAIGETYDMATTGVYANNAQRVVTEGVGWDVVTLVLAVPALLVAAWFVRKGSFRGQLFATGLLGYFFYAYLEYSVTWAFGPLFLLFVAIHAASFLGILGMIWSLATSGAGERLAETFPRRGWAVLNLAMSGLLTLSWLARIRLALNDEPGILLGETTLTVQALDLGLMVPLSVLTAVLVLRRVEVGYLLAAAFGVTYMTMTVAITAMLLSAWAVEGTLEVPPVAIFGLAALSSLVLLARTYRAPTRVGRGAIATRATKPAPVG
jgi:hypothetical protein